MTETEARRVLLMRAFEDPPAAPWSEGDMKWAGIEALRAEGAEAEPERLLARRAQLASQRLAERAPFVRSVLDFRSSLGWIAALLGVLALAAAITSDLAGPTGRINIVAPPLLAILAWNLVAYVVILSHQLTRGGPGPIRRALWKMARRVRITATIKAHRAPLARFLADWTRASAALNGARIAALLHAGAAAVACGALLSLYLRGLAFEYRAGWESTFLDVDGVHALLSFVLGPASVLSGIVLPGREELAGLRFSVGFGENAARFIHLHAITALILVVVPRVLLAALAAWKARRIARDFPLPLSDAYFQRLVREQSDAPVPVLVLPYSYRLPAEASQGLASLFERSLGPRVRMSITEPIALGSVEPPPPAPEGVQVVALFALTATPEHETHGLFLRALRSAHAHALALVDESGFRERFGRERLEQRRDAWRRLLQEAGLKPAFVDLARPGGTTESRPQPLSFPAA